MSSNLLSLVIPTYNVESYLPAFLAGLDAQRGGLDGVELVFVNDGSTDGSAALVQAWIDRTGAPARLLTKENGGLSSARNAGLAMVTGEWVTFPDPDDVLTPDYLANVRGFLRGKAARRIDLAAANLVYLDDPGGQVVDSHPLRFKFTQHHRVVDLERHPNYIHLSGATGFYRREVLEQGGLRFDERIRPNFEDAHLTALYLARFDRPRIGMIDDAVYHYRRRADGSGLVASSWAREEKYLTIPRFGWLDLVQRATKDRGAVPRWMQNLILYDLSYYFQWDGKTQSPLPGLPARCKAEFLAVTTEVLAHLDTDMIEGFSVNPISDEIRRAMLIGLKGHGATPVEGYLDRLDEHQRVVRLRYYYGGDRPAEQIRSRGNVVEPVHAKTRRITYFDRVMMHERIAWLPADSALSVSLDGRALPLRVGRPELPRYAVGPKAVWTGLGPPDGPSRLHRALDGIRALPVNARKQLEVTTAKTLSRSPYGRLRYRNAWLLIDRDTGAQDNAEHLYRYLRAEQPQINAWFVLAPDSPDWARLEAEGFRLLAHGSREHTVALLQCQHIVSSQVDSYITTPLDPKVYGPRTWRYTFLQHGVTKDDLSNWINHTPINLMITVTPDEHHSIVDDETPYRYTTKQVKLTGFPRHDRLLALGREPRVGEPLLLVMPTWRRELLSDRGTAAGNERDLRADFWESGYARSWRALLESAELERAATAAGWRIAFVPHPNMQGYVDTWPAPPHVQLHRFDRVDIQQVLARGAMLVTDYSSLAFEMAYLERPVVYYQFDRDVFFNGMHAYRRGDWSYEEQGFGPVTTELAPAVEEIVKVITAAGVPEPAYATRMRDTFPFRDGECSRRTYEAIADLYRAQSADEVCRKVD